MNYLRAQPPLTLTTLAYGQHTHFQGLFPHSTRVAESQHHSPHSLTQRDRGNALTTQNRVSTDDLGQIDSLSIPPSAYAEGPGGGTNSLHRVSTDDLGQLDPVIQHTSPSRFQRASHYRVIIIYLFTRRVSSPYLSLPPTHFYTHQYRDDDNHRRQTE